MEFSSEQISDVLKELQMELEGGKAAPAKPVEPASQPTVSTPVFTAVSGINGIFPDAESAVQAAIKSQRKLMDDYTMEDRERFVSAMRQAARENAVYLSELAHKETGYGHIEDKIAKHHLVADKTPGTEDLHTYAKSGDDGLMLTEMAPFGVIGAITPSTNPTSTVICNGIGMIAAGNSVVFNPHPAAKKCSLEAVRLMNQAIVSAGGPDNLLCAPAEPNMDTSAVIMNHPRIRLLAVTGGEAVVKIAMRTGKRCIAAGPGNPPVVVDRTANIRQAAADIVKGAHFDNCILCIAEKEILVEDCVADELIKDLVNEGAYLVNPRELEEILKIVMVTNKEGKHSPNKKYVGKDAGFILKEAGISTTIDPKIILAEVPFEHPLVMTEMLMPVIPITRCANVDDAIEKAVIAENGCHHTAMMHSENIHNLTKMAKAVDTTIFVKNAPSYAGLSIEGEGYTTLTIATPTGEGLSSAKHFTRARRCTLHGAFRII